MYAVEFKTKIDNGIVKIPIQYDEIRKIDDNIKVILMIDEDAAKPIKKRELNAISLDLSDFKFDRDEAHER